MPNWCSNQLTVRCAPGTFSDIVSKYVEGDEFLADAVDPCPDELTQVSAPNRGKNAGALIKKYGYADWYEWRIAHWGTKWRPSSVYVRGQTIFMESAWSPPAALVKSLSKLYPRARFTLLYHEGGMAFAGRFVVQNGLTLIDDAFDDSSDSRGYNNIRRAMARRYRIEEQRGC